MQWPDFWVPTWVPWICWFPCWSCYFCDQEIFICQLKPFKYEMVQPTNQKAVQKGRELTKRNAIWKGPRGNLPGKDRPGIVQETGRGVKLGYSRSRLFAGTCSKAHSWCVEYRSSTTQCVLQFSYIHGAIISFHRFIGWNVLWLLFACLNGQHRLML